MDKENVVHMYDTILFSLTKKKAILSFATTWVNLQEHYAKRNKQGRERQMPYDLTSVWNPKKSNS
jgi:hypothetical protein